MAESKKPSLFGKFFKGRRSEKVTPKDLQEQEATVRRDPNNLRALHKLGDLYAKAEQPEKAIETYIRAADSYIERAFYQKAVAVYKQILKMKPTLFEIQKKLAEVYLELGRRSDALSQYQDLVRKYEASGSLSLAAETLSAMLELDEDNVPMRVKLAEIYLGMSETNNAISEFEKALNSLANQENWADYVKVGERLLYAAPEHLGALKTIARVYLDNGDVMKAMGKLQKAFKLERRDPETLEVLAVAFDRLDQPQKTISVLKELAEIYKDLGRVDYVRDVYMQILERDPQEAETLQALSALPAAKSVSDLPAAAPVIQEAPPTPPTMSPPTPPPLPPEANLSLSDEELERLLNEADVYIKYGLAPRVEEALNRIFATYPEHTEARHLKVELLKMQERFEEAANELLLLAKATDDRQETFILLEKILELENVPPMLQEEAYQMSVRLQAPQESTSQEFVHSADNFSVVPTSSDEIAIPEPEYQQSADGFEVVGEISSIEITSADDLDFVSGSSEELEEIEIVSLDDLPAISSDSLDEIVIDDPFSQDELPQASTLDADTSATHKPHDSFQHLEEYGSVEELSGTPFSEELVPEVQELELLDEADEVTIPPTHQEAFAYTDGTDASARPTPNELSFAVAPSFEESTNPEIPVPTEPSAPTPPSSLFAPPPEEEPEEDAFGQFLMRAKESEELEEEEDAYSGFDDFLKDPIILEPEPPTMSSPTASSGGDELSDMEAAAARLQALIQAKEEAEQAAQAEQDEKQEQKESSSLATEIPPPFAVSSPVSDIPPPFASPISAPEEAFAASTEGTPSEEDVFVEEKTHPSVEVPAVGSSPSQEQHIDSDAFAAEALEEEELDFSDFSELDDAFEEFGEEESSETGSFSIDPSDPYIEDLEEAFFYLDQEEPQYAIEHFDRVLKQDPEHEVAKAGIAVAIELEQTLQEQNQQKDGFLFDLDTALGEITTTKRERDRVEGELRAFKEEAQKQFGEDGETLYELGVAYYGMGLYEMASETFQNCIHTHYREFDCYKMIGACHTAQGATDQALSTYQSALQLPNITKEERLDILFEMAAVYESLGNQSDALAYYEEVSMLDENYRSVQMRIQALHQR